MDKSELWRRCTSPIECSLLGALYPVLDEEAREDLVAQFEMGYLRSKKTRIDFAFPRLNIAIYCDGYEWHNDKTTFIRDRVQLRALQLRGWLVLRFAGSEIYHNIDDVILQIQGAIFGRRFTLDIEQGEDGDKDWVYYLNRGVAYYGLGDYDPSINNLTKSIEMKPDAIDAYQNRGMAYYAKGDFDSAITDFTEAINLNRYFTIAYYGHGLVHAEKNQFDEAIKDFSETIKLRPGYAQAYYERGNAYSNVEDYDRALVLPSEI